MINSLKIMKNMIQFCVLLGMAISLNAAQDLAPRYLSLTDNPQELLLCSLYNQYPLGVQTALKMGANPNNVYCDERNALSFAVKDLNTCQPSSQAATLKKQEIVSILLDSQVDLSPSINDREKPVLDTLFRLHLRFSSFLYHEQIAEKLLQKGANPRLENMHHDLPLCLLARHYTYPVHANTNNFYAKMIKLLMRYGADPYEKPAHNIYKSVTNIGPALRAPAFMAPALIAQIEKDFEQEQLANQTLHFLADEATSKVQKGHAFPADPLAMISFMLKRNEIKKSIYSKADKG